ncbi:MAG: hypothetical protein ABI678_08935 [Kofleriaceae bacterium]
MRSVLIVIWLAATAHAKPTDDWLGDLTDHVIADLAAGKPLVVEVHAPLCEGTIIACGNKKLGDGDNPETNLYWSTTPGFGAWFARRGSGWKRVLKQTADETGDHDLVAVHVYRRDVTAPSGWVKRGAPKHFELDIVIHGWRGTSIDKALAAYAADVSGVGTRELVLADKSKLAAGGAAQLVAFVGHNRLMDLETFTWPEPGVVTKGAIAIACDTAPYMKQQVSAATRVPLLMTSDLLFANAAPLEAAVLAFARGGGYAEIRKDAATAYAGIQEVPVKRVWGTFTNPSDKRW